MTETTPEGGGRLDRPAVARTGQPGFVGHRGDGVIATSVRNETRHRLERENGTFQPFPERALLLLTNPCSFFSALCMCVLQSARVSQVSKTHQFLAQMSIIKNLHF